MTATAIHTSQAVTEWTKIFPRQVTENYTSSVTFMKQLTVVAVSTITYLKNAFSEENYTVDTFGGLKIRTLKNKCKDDLAQFLSTALTQAFDAFDKKYLHQLALCFYDGECKLENLLEYHIFEYSYKQDAVTMTISSKSRDNSKTSLTYTLDNIKEKTMHLIRACVVMMQTNPLPLPETCDVSLRLYYNEDAPEGYQAPGYLTAKDCEDPLGFTYDDTLKLGWVETPYHKLTLRTYVRDSLRASREVIPSENPPMMSEAPDEFHTGDNLRRDSVSDGSSAPLRCACNNYECEDVPSVLITCQYCRTQQHAACYGLVSAPAASHCCVSCSDAEPARRPTDRRLAAVAPRKRDCFAIFRRTLWWCAGASRVATNELAHNLGLTAVSAAKLMRLLHNNGVVRQEPYADLMTPAQINHEQLKAVMSQYFQTDEQDIVDRLVAESFASQESQSDPVGDVLSPLEKVSLHNTSNLGRVIIPEVNNNIEDTTLKQYREALVMVEKIDDEMPLSGSHNPVKDMEKIGKRAGKRKVEGKDEKLLKSGVKIKKAKTTRK